MDRDGAIWAGLKTGVAASRADKSATSTEAMDWLTTIILAIVPDNHGDLWMHSSRGLPDASTGRSANDFADGRTNKRGMRASMTAWNLSNLLKHADIEFSGCRSPRRADLVSDPARPGHD